MAASPPPNHLLPLFSILSLLLPFSSSSSSQTTITLSLSPLPIPQYPHTHYTPPLIHKLIHLASSSISRARQLKNTTSSQTPLSPKSYGGYSISLSFGFPPQTLAFVMDTGSSLVWFPCTNLYLCSQCNFPNVDPANITTFNPKLSATSKILDCKDPRCGLLFGPDVQTRCQLCDPTVGQCTQNCPDYVVEYASGTTAGRLLSETLVFANNNDSGFVVGCSVLSDNQPSGIAGFGRGPASLPSQMGLRKFSYCLVSHQFDDTPEASDLVLFRHEYSGNGSLGGVRYTPFIDPLVPNASFQDYYYLNLRKITVGGVHVKVPNKILTPSPEDGNGGTIIDSGTTFTYMDNEVFELVAGEFEKQMGNFCRVKDVELRTGLRPCYDISGGDKVVVPKLFFHFKGGAKMAFPLADYFSLVDDDSRVVCMTMVSNEVGATTGPSIIIGNYQQQNFYVEYDLERSRLGFRKQICR